MEIIKITVIGGNFLSDLPVGEFLKIHATVRGAKSVDHFRSLIRSGEEISEKTLKDCMATGIQ